MSYQCEKLTFPTDLHHLIAIQCLWGQLLKMKDAVESYTDRHIKGFIICRLHQFYYG